jgi:hypothetical protein
VSVPARDAGPELVRHLAGLVMSPLQDPGLPADRWRTLLGVAVRERCAALAWVRASDAIVRWAPAETAAAWRQLYITIAARGHAQIAAASEAAAALHRSAIHPITLKGFPLAAMLYGDASARACTDIDWFVPLADRPQAQRALTAAGWIHHEGGLPWDETVERSGPHGTMYIEVHSSLLHPRFAYLPVPEPDYEPMLVEGVAVRRHAGPLLPGYLAAHLAQHAAPPLLWDIDFATLWQRLPMPDRAAARRAARQAGLGRYLRWAERRAALVMRLAAGDRAAAGALGFTGVGRSDVHPAWRHVRLAPTLASAARALDGWLRPPWVRETYGPGVTGVVRRVARHWRAALARGERVGDRAPDDGSAIATGIARVEPGRMLEVARGVTREGGAMWIVATGASMLPTIAPGDRVRIGPVGVLRPGVVVLADAGGAPVLHRVVRVHDREVVLRGDACRMDDAPIRPADVVAAVQAVARGAAVRPEPPSRAGGGARS